ncbi:MAG TPA: transcription antitermination factor NusB [Gammaproteobacteria bacterium]|nr:transcription antitermination factor NusB [Gammaproteobacteria bacterium]
MARDPATRARHLTRELLVKALYQWQIAGHGLPELRRQFSALADFERCDADYFNELLKIVIDDVAALDALIARYAVRSVEQLDAVGRAVLLLGLAELKHRAEIPTKVVINEAVELTKRYGVTDGHKFVNAVLDKASREIDRTAAVPGGKP